MEEAVRTRQGEEDEVALFMAHEIRNVLAVISTLSLAGAGSPEQETFAKIRRQCDVAGAIVADVLALGTSPLPTEPLVLDELIGSLAIPSHGDHGATVLAHAGLLTRVLSVLRDNARRAKPNELSFAIWISQQKERVTLAAVDNGPGVPAELRDRIFERGVSGAQSTGLGLYFARKVARAHQGELILAMPRPGEGARFELTLPAYRG